MTHKLHAAGHLVGGRYEIRATVGKRPLGMMYRAFDREVEVEVALRVLSAELLPDQAARQAFAQRIGRARGLAHPNLMRFHGVAVEEDEVAVAVQWAPGTTLKDTIPEKGMAPAAARPILAQVAAGMQHAHTQGLVLGDVRPETVIVYADGIKLSNIGIGLALPRRTFLEAMQTTPGHAYLAPELRAGRVAEPRADVFSLATLTVELLTGQPLQSGTRISLQTLARLPPALGPALSRALAEDPMVRQASVDALAREIEVILSTGTAPRPKRPSLPPLDQEPGTLPDARPRGFGLPISDNETRQVSEDELKIQGQQVTRRVSEEELLPLRLQSSEEPILEMEAGFEGEDRPSREDSDEHDTEPVMLLEADAIRTEPVAKIDPPYDDEEETTTVRVEKLDPEELRPVNGVVSSAPPPPPRREIVPPSRPPPPPVESLPKIEVIGLPVEPKAPTPPRGAPRSPSPSRGTPVLSPLPPPVLPPLQPPQPAFESPPPPQGALVVEPMRGHPTMEVKPLAASPPQPRSRRGVIAGVGVILAIAGVLALVVLSITDHLHEVHLTQERASKQRLAEELNARAEAIRRASAPAPPRAEPKAAAPKAPAAKAPEPAPPAAAVVPVAAPSSNGCPLGANLVDGSHRFCVDLYEYPGGKTIPRTEVSFEEAGRLCALRGERLCSTDEWERACRGKSGASYPYGQSFDPTRCNTRGSGGEVAPTGSFADCKSASGAYDMSGNVSEWVTSAHGPLQKGGSFLATNPQTRCSNVLHGAPDTGSQYVGFRCCADLP